MFCNLWIASMLLKLIKIMQSNYSDWRLFVKVRFDLFFFIKGYKYLRVPRAWLRAPFLQLCPEFGDAILTRKDLTGTFQTSVKFLVFPTHLISSSF